MDEQNKNSELEPVLANIRYHLLRILNFGIILINSILVAISTNIIYGILMWFGLTCISIILILKKDSTVVDVEKTTVDEIKLK